MLISLAEKMPPKIVYELICAGANKVGKHFDVDIDFNKVGDDILPIINECFAGVKTIDEGMERFQLALKKLSQTEIAVKYGVDKSEIIHKAANTDYANLPNFVCDLVTNLIKSRPASELT